MIRRKADILQNVFALANETTNNQCPVLSQSAHRFGGPTRTRNGIVTLIAGLQLLWPSASQANE